MTTKAKTSLAAVALLATLGLGASSAAHAGGDVFWSIAMSQPGVQVGVSNAPPMPILVHESRPIYMPPPPPVYVPQPRVVYLPPPPVYRATYYGYGYGYGPGYGQGWGRGWGHERGHRDWEERHEHRGGYGGYERGDRGGSGRYEGGGRGPEMHIGRH